jgi:hypothetical protein
MQIPASTTRENPITRHPPSDPFSGSRPRSPTCTLSLPLLHRRRFPSSVFPSRRSRFRDKDFSLHPWCLFLVPPLPPRGTHREQRKGEAYRRGKALIERRPRAGRPSKNLASLHGERERATLPISSASSKRARISLPLLSIDFQIPRSRKTDDSFVLSKIPKICETSENNVIEIHLKEIS